MRKALLPVALTALLGGLLVIAVGLEERLSWPTVKQRIRADLPEVRQVSAGALAALLASAEARPVLLDVREEAEYRVSHLPGAVRVDPGAERLQLPPGVEKDTPIVVYCSVGYRSSALAERLTRQGYSAVSNLEGSIFEWANEGNPVVRDGEEVRQVHPYNELWGRLLDSELHAYD